MPGGGLEGALGGGGLDLGGGLGAPGGEAPGGAPPGGEAPGGAPPGGAAPGGAPMPSTSRDSVNIGDYGGRVLNEKSRRKMDRLKSHAEPAAGGGGKGGDGFERDDRGRIWRTKLEMSLEKGLIERYRAGKIRSRWISGYEVKHGSHPYLMDFAFPDLKVDVEADGETFHSAPAQMERDRQRDAILRNLGWVVIRFGETEIKDQLTQALDRIERELAKKEEFIRSRNKK